MKQLVRRATELLRKSKQTAKQAEDNIGHYQCYQRVKDNSQAEHEHWTPSFLLKPFNFKRKTNTDKGQGEEPDAQVGDIGENRTGLRT